MHKFSVQKEYKGSYKTCCGHTIEYYTSDDFGAPDSFGWYVTFESGEFEGWRWVSLKEAKASLEREHLILDLVRA